MKIRVFPFLLIALGTLIPLVSPASANTNTRQCTVTTFRPQIDSSHVIYSSVSIKCTGSSGSSLNAVPYPYLEYSTDNGNNWYSCGSWNNVTNGVGNLNSYTYGTTYTYTNYTPNQCFPSNYNQIWRTTVGLTFDDDTTMTSFSASTPIHF